jgi:hypothetical protein
MAKTRTPEQQAIVDGMDAAARDAEKALKKLDKGAVKTVAAWMAEHFSKAGYKRLSRLLVAQVKESKPAKATKGDKEEGAEEE